MKKTTIFAILIVIAAFLLSIYAFPSLPDRVVSHWNTQGEPNGYMPRFFGAFLVPIILAILVPLLIFLPMLDPLKKNYKKFESYYDWFIIIFTAFMLYIHSLTIFWNLNYRFNFNLMIIPAFGILFIFVGFLTENAKRNWFVGIRTPWTLSNDKVWDKTHKLGGKLFKLSGLISLLGIIFQKQAFLLLIIPVILTAIITFIYSYFVYRKMAK